VEQAEFDRLQVRKDGKRVMLEEQLSIQQTFLTGTISGKHNVILVFGICGAGTCELEIPKRNYDPLFAAGDH